MNEFLSTAEAFRRFRRELGKTQRDVAKELGVTQPAYAVYESKGVSPTGNILIKMALTFGVSTDYLLGLTDDPTPNWNNAVEKTDEPVPPPEKSSSESDAISLTARISILEERLEKLERRVGV